jgi:GntR family histidine utilization transcriptional repressor
LATGKRRKERRPSDFELDGDGPVYLQIERAVRSKVQSGAWPPGYRIPTEIDLMRLAQCSRATINKALTNLANAKLIVRQRRHGSHIRQSTEEHAVLGILDIRKQIEGAARTYSYEVIERRVLNAGDGSVCWPEVEPGEPLLWLLAVHRGNGEAEVIEERLIRLALAPDAEQESFKDTPPNAWLLARLPCTRLAHSISARLATGRETELLDLPRQCALLVSERRTWAESEPVTWVRLSFPGERNQFSGEFNPLNPD